MTHSPIKRLLVVAMAVPLTWALLMSQHRRLGNQKSDADKPAAKKKVRSKPRGRLPAYYNAVVSPDQRERIYGIQAQYAEQIDKLLERLKMLTAERHAAVKGVLTPQQQAKVAQLRAEAKAKRAAARKKKAAGSSQQKRKSSRD